MTGPAFIEVLLSSASIMLIDLILAGDNAVVIGMAARTLLPDQRRRAILIGSLLAVFLRVLATLLVVHLLKVPFLSAIGGILVCWIGVKLLVEDRESEGSQRNVQKFWHAIRLIAVADFVMSTDNILAVSGVSSGRFELIFFGLVVSIPLVVFCSSWIAGLLDRYPRLSELGAAVLGWTGGQMILQNLLQSDPRSGGLLATTALGPWLGPVTWGTKIALSVGVVWTAKVWINAQRRRRDRLSPRVTATSSGSRLVIYPRLPSAARSVPYEVGERSELG